MTVRMTIAGEQVRLLVDTGSSDLVLFKARMPAALLGAPWRGDKTVQYASGAARLQRLRAAPGRPRGGGLGHTASLDPGPSADGYPPGIDGVLGVRSLACRRVRFDFEKASSAGADESAT